MLQTQPPAYEQNRLDTLHNLQILDTPRDDRYDRYTRICTRIFEVPIAAISLVDKSRQWFKSTDGFTATELPRGDSFCSYTILGDDIFEIRDASRDPRFRDNPAVIGQQKIRFYAGAPLKAPNGHNLGTLCILDTVPRTLSAQEKIMLKNLADKVVADMVEFIDIHTGLDNLNALRMVGAGCFNMPAADRKVSLVLFDISKISEVPGITDPKLSTGATFTKLLRRNFPFAQSIAHVADSHFCVLFEDDNQFDVAPVIQRLCAEAQASFCYDRDNNAVSTLVGRIRYESDKYVAIEDMLREADRLFLSTERSTLADTTENFDSGNPGTTGIPGAVRLFGGAKNNG